MLTRVLVFNTQHIHSFGLLDIWVVSGQVVKNMVPLISFPDPYTSFSLLQKKKYWLVEQEIVR